MGNGGRMEKVKRKLSATGTNEGSSRNRRLEKPQRDCSTANRSLNPEVHYNRRENCTGAELNEEGRVYNTENALNPIEIRETDAEGVSGPNSDSRPFICVIRKRRRQSRLQSRLQRNIKTNENNSQNLNRERSERRQVHIESNQQSVLSYSDRSGEASVYSKSRNKTDTRTKKSSKDFSSNVSGRSQRKFNKKSGKLEIEKLGTNIANEVIASRTVEGGIDGHLEDFNEQINEINFTNVENPSDTITKNNKYIGNTCKAPLTNEELLVLREAMKILNVKNLYQLHQHIADWPIIPQFIWPSVPPASGGFIPTETEGLSARFIAKQPYLVSWNYKGTVYYFHAGSSCLSIRTC